MLPADLPARLQQALGPALRVEELLGVGGFAAVFRAHDPLLERDVAVKVLTPGAAADGARDAQFLHHARALAGVEHPHIVPLYDAGAREGLLYLVMRLLPGQPLRDRMVPGAPMPVAEAVRIAREVALALAAAAERGVVHRDIKPENILLDASGHALVTDFGIASVKGRGTEADEGSTGTPAYMSPEQGLGEPVDARSDVYACGVVLFELLTGTLPFEGKTALELLTRRVGGVAPLVSTRAPDTPAALVALVARMLAQAPADRPTAAEVATALAAVATPAGLRSPRQVRRRRLLRVRGLVVLAGGAASLALGGAISLAVSFARLMLSPGAEPALAVARPSIPDSVARLVRARGALEPGEELVAVFVAAGRTLEDALLATDRSVIRQSPGAPPRRFPHATRGGGLPDRGTSSVDVTIKVNTEDERAAGAPPVEGLVRMQSPAGRQDTVLRALSSTEMRRLLGLVDAVRVARSAPARKGRSGDAP